MGGRHGTVFALQQGIERLRNRSEGLCRPLLAAEKSCQGLRLSLCNKSAGSTAEVSLNLQSADSAQRAADRLRRGEVCGQLTALRDQLMASSPGVGEGSRARRCRDSRKPW